MSWFSGVSPEPHRPPCKVVPDPDEWRYCNAPSGSHTALGFPICDECWEAVRDETVPTSPEPVEGFIREP